MTYSLLNLKTPRSRLGRAASTVYNPLSRQVASPVAAPDYNQQVSSMMGQNQAPQFAAGTPNAQSTGDFSFSNATNPAFQQTAMAAPTSAGGVDYSKDPIYAQTQAAVAAQIAQAQAAAIGSEKQALIRYGDPSLIAKVLGEEDQSTSDAAKNNSFSTVAELGRWNDRSLSGIDTATNRNNLYFSSTRGRDRGLQQEDYVRQSASTANQLQDVLSGVASGLLGQEQAGQATLLGAGESAYMRALQMALANPAAAGGTAPSSPYAAAEQGAFTASKKPSPYMQWWQRGGGWS